MCIWKDFPNAQLTKICISLSVHEGTEEGNEWIASEWRCCITRRQTNKQSLHHTVKPNLVRIALWFVIILKTWSNLFCFHLPQILTWYYLENLDVQVTYLTENYVMLEMWAIKLDKLNGIKFKWLKSSWIIWNQDIKQNQFILVRNCKQGVSNYCAI